MTHSQLIMLQQCFKMVHCSLIGKITMKNTNRIYRSLLCVSLFLSSLSSLPAYAIDWMQMQTPACSSRESYFADRWNTCKSSNNSDSYCASWMGCTGPLTINIKINGTTGSIQAPAPTCTSRESYFADRWNACKSSNNSDSYCSSWMGCAGSLTISPSLTVTGVAQSMPMPAPSCQSNVNYYTEKWKTCKESTFIDGNKPGTDAYCANWIGCNGQLTVPGTIIGTAR